MQEAVPVEIGPEIVQTMKPVQDQIHLHDQAPRQEMHIDTSTTMVTMEGTQAAVRNGRSPEGPPPPHLLPKESFASQRLHVRKP